MHHIPIKRTSTLPYGRFNNSLSLSVLKKDNAETCNKISQCHSAKIWTVSSVSFTILVHYHFDQSTPSLSGVSHKFNPSRSYNKHLVQKAYSDDEQKTQTSAKNWCFLPLFMVFLFSTFSQQTSKHCATPLLTLNPNLLSLFTCTNFFQTRCIALLQVLHRQRNWVNNLLFMHSRTCTQLWHSLLYVYQHSTIHLFLDKCLQWVCEIQYDRSFLNSIFSILLTRLSGE